MGSLFLLGRKGFQLGLVYAFYYFSSVSLGLRFLYVSFGFFDGCASRVGFYNPFKSGGGTVPYLVPFS